MQLTYFDLALLNNLPTESILDHNIETHELHYISKYFCEVKSKNDHLFKTR